MKGWDVFLSQGVWYDKVFWADTADADEIKKSLIEHDNYPSDITVVAEDTLTTKEK